MKTVFAVAGLLAIALNCLGMTSKADVLVADLFENRILRLSDTGNFISILPTTGLNAPRFMAFAPDGDLLISEFSAGKVKRFDFDTEQTTDFITGVNSPSGMVVASDGTLYLSRRSRDSIVRYDATTGAYLGVVAEPPVSGQGWDLVQGPNGNLYQLAFGSARGVYEYGTDGTYYGRIISSGLSNPRMAAFDASGNLYIADRNNDRVQAYNPSGSLIRNISAFDPEGVMFMPDGSLLISQTRSSSGASSGDILRWDSVSNTTSVFFADQSLLNYPNAMLYYDPAPQQDSQQVPAPSMLVIALAWVALLRRSLAT